MAKTTKKPMTIQEASAIAKQFGIKILKTKDFEIEFFPHVKMVEDVKAEGQGLPTEEEMLYWSSDYDPNANKDKPEHDGVEE
jgi:hypothetical protein